MAINIKVSSPVYTSNSKSFNLQQLNNYTHTLFSFGGYGPCSFTIPGDNNVANDWLENGLGRDILASNENGEIYNGVVNSITVQSTLKTITRGSLFGIINKLHLAYAPIWQNSVGQNLIGSKTFLSAIEDTTSHASFGIMERILLAGQATSTSALQYQTSQLARLKNPRQSESNSPLSRTGSIIKVDCVGYHNYLNYPYTSSTIGETNLSLKIGSIIGSEPNSIFSTDLTKITENTTQILAKETKSNGLNVIKSLVTQSDVSDNRYIFGVYSGRRAEYTPAPTTVGYTQSGSSNDNVIIDARSKSAIKPENVLPGRWIRRTDMLIGKNQPANIEQSENSIFIEGVTFNSPNQVVISGTSPDGQLETLMLRSSLI